MTLFLTPKKTLTKNKSNLEFWEDATNACTRTRFTKLAKIFMTDVQAFAFAPNLERPFAILYNVRPISVWMWSIPFAWNGKTRKVLWLSLHFVVLRYPNAKVTEHVTTKEWSLIIMTTSRPTWLDANRDVIAKTVKSFAKKLATSYPKNLLVILLAQQVLQLRYVPQI